ncbi:hypothetical protein [Craterilacuibacter sinensis]|uniref:Uncharacterized protein n=1 Tax=Craterilacuibacter sinensis TaxID=2686017 RepID=A0A845BMV4_9NEIS|nr:hypothetical protein [Craterilacuibacter sinensis]MXR36730.1 hypothetical protein [Craterilacuibacter sinensis]
MKLTKEQRQELINKLDSPWGRVSLLCDGHKVSLAVERAKGMRYRVITYVDGRWEGKWMSGREEHPEQKFLNKQVRPVVSKKYKADMEKAVGKRYFKKMCAEESYLTKNITVYNISWASGRSAINHLCKVCDSIQIVTEEETA